MLREQVPLAELTTLRVGGPATCVLPCASVADIESALTQLRERALPFLVLGQGSNVFASDEPIHAGILLMQIPGISYDAATGTVIAGAGVSWDSFVRFCAEQQLWGVENLAGIPGTVGATPVQNVGAYGADVSDTISWVECYNALEHKTVRISAQDCAFGYRDSRFKREPHLIITQVAFALSAAPRPNLKYADLARAQSEGAVVDTPQVIGDAVRVIRARKFPDLTICGTAGSFFKNPILSKEQFAELAVRFPELPHYPDGEKIKVSLAWILDHVLHLRGFRMGKAYLFEQQPLVLVTDEGATAREVTALASEVTARVYEATHITIEKEVRVFAS